MPEPLIAHCPSDPTAAADYQKRVAVGIRELLKHAPELSVDAMSAYGELGRRVLRLMQQAGEDVS